MAAELPDVFVRFEGIEGECMDQRYPGKAAEKTSYPAGQKFGWFQIKSFSFNFGVKDKEALGAGGAPRSGASGGGSTSDGSGNDGPLDRSEVTLSKNLDVGSASIWKDNCHSGKVIAEAEVVACRQGGTGGDEKIPFVRFIFQEVYITDISMALAEESLPTETMHFSYDRMRMESLWTDNETGDRAIDRPRRAGWDFMKNKDWSGEDV